MVGKKVRNETRIVGGIASIGGAAAAVMARSIFSDLKERVVVVFGAGTMAASSVRHLRSKGAGKLYISNRSLDKAQALAADLGGEPVTLAEGFDRLTRRTSRSFRRARTATCSTGTQRSPCLAAAAAGHCSSSTSRCRATWLPRSPRPRAFTCTTSTTILTCPHSSVENI